MRGRGKEWVHAGEWVAAVILILWAASGVWWFRAGGPAHTAEVMVRISEGRIGVVALWPERVRGHEDWQCQVMSLPTPALQWGWQFGVKKYRSMTLLVVNVPLWGRFGAVARAPWRR